MTRRIVRVRQAKGPSELRSMNETYPLEQAAEGYER
jgi:hypothetical protein